MFVRAAPCAAVSSSLRRRPSPPSRRRSSPQGFRRRSPGRRAGQSRSPQRRPQQRPRPPRRARRPDLLSPSHPRGPVGERQPLPDSGLFLQRHLLLSLLPELVLPRIRPPRRPPHRQHRQHGHRSARQPARPGWPTRCHLPVRLSRRLGVEWRSPPPALLPPPLVPRRLSHSHPSPPRPPAGFRRHP